MSSSVIEKTPDTVDNKDMIVRSNASSLSKSSKIKSKIMFQFCVSNNDDPHILF